MLYPNCLYPTDSTCVIKGTNKKSFKAYYSEKVVEYSILVCQISKIDKRDSGVIKHIFQHNEGQNLCKWSKIMPTHEDFQCYINRYQSTFSFDSSTTLLAAQNHYNGLAPS